VDRRGLPPGVPLGGGCARRAGRRREQQHRDGALWRRSLAQDELDRLGPVGRRKRPARRREIEARIAHSDAAIARHDVKLAELDRRLEAFAPAVTGRSAWERQHAPELRRIEDLDRRIERSSDSSRSPRGVSNHASTEVSLAPSIVDRLDPAVERHVLLPWISVLDPVPPVAVRSQISGERFNIAGVDFVSSLVESSRSDRLAIKKNPALVDRYRRLLHGLPQPRIFELGIAQGGSVAMLALLGDPERLVAIEVSPQPVQALADFIEARGLSDRVRPYYGVDQGDRHRLLAILAAEMDGGPLDLVVDDASHRYGQTRASFEVLFPALRPGGLYIIEDWSWHHIVSEAIAATIADPSAPDHAVMTERLAEVGGGTPGEPPLSRLAVQLVLGLSLPRDAVVEVTINENWVLVRRGSATLDPKTFRVDDLYTDRLGLLSR
jgi:predicted O-methyltransferase YrrM